MALAAAWYPERISISLPIDMLMRIDEHHKLLNGEHPDLTLFWTAENS